MLSNGILRLVIVARRLLDAFNAFSLVVAGRGYCGSRSGRLERLDDGDHGEKGVVSNVEEL